MASGLSNHFILLILPQKLNQISRYQLGRVTLSARLTNANFYADCLINKMISGYLKMGAINCKIVQEFLPCEDEVAKIFNKKINKE